MLQQLKYILYALACITLCACVTDPDIQYPNTPAGNVEALYHIIDEKYCFVEEKGVNWDDIYARYLPQAEALDMKDERGLFRLMAGMLDSLRDGHVNLYSAFDISRNNAWYEGYPANYNGSLLGKYIGSDYMLAGGISYQKIIGQDSIGYIRYSSFSNDFTNANLYYVLSYFADCKGLILDVRNNGGGSLETAYKLASVFMDSTTQVGYWQHKTGKGHNDYSQPEPICVERQLTGSKWFRPVVVLCNRQSYSATNMFVNCMQHVPNCLIAGGTTGGGGGMPLSYELPNGWMIRFSSVRMFDTEMKSIENGILPQEEITLTSSDKDDIIEYAISYINKL